MSTNHLTDDELDLAITGESMSTEVERHLGECLVCRRRRDSFLAALRGAAGEDPGILERETIRAGAVAGWARQSPLSRWWWLAAAAVILLAFLIPVHHAPQPATANINPDAVLRDVDTVLARDPLAAFASENVVETVLPTRTREERSSI
jgi:hypothetical protein